MYCSDLDIGDLVCIKSWSTEETEGGWISLPDDYGIILEVIEVEYEFVFIDQKTRCYDYVVYWIIKQQLDTLPDIILERYVDWMRRIDER